MGDKIQTATVTPHNHQAEDLKPPSPNAYEEAVTKMGIKEFPSENAPRQFFTSLQEDQERLKNSVSIQITEEELEHAKKFLELIQDTGGQTIKEKSQRDIYVKQGILPENPEQPITEANIRNFYKRLIEKRPLMFINPWDDIVPRSGFPDTKDLDEYICYSEIELAAMLGVSGETFFINNGSRFNEGGFGAKDSYQKSGRITAIVGARMEINNGMEALHLKPNKLEELADEDSIGRIAGVNKEFIDGYKKLYSQGLYENLDGTKAENGNLCDDRLVKRLEISYRKLFADAIQNSEATGNKSYIRIVGLGDGVWSGENGDQVSNAIGKSVRKIFDSLLPENKAKIAAIEFSQYKHEKYFEGFKGVGVYDLDSDKELNGVTIISNNSNNPPFSNKLPEKFKDCELSVNFAWDGGSYVGNEYWDNDLTASGDPAAVCCSAIGVTMNPQLNPRFLDKIQVISPNCKTRDLSAAMTHEPAAPALKPISKPPSPAPQPKTPTVTLPQHINLKNQIKEYTQNPNSDELNPEIKTLLDDQVNSQLKIPEPKLAYRGCGIKATFNEKGELVIDEIFAKDIKRFYETGYEDKIVEDNSGMEGKIIKKIFIRDPENPSKGEWKEPIDLELEEIAEIFHSPTKETRIMLSDGPHNIVYCKAEDKNLFVTQSCETAKKGLQGKSGDKYDVDQHGTGAIDPDSKIVTKIAAINSEIDSSKSK